MSSEAPEHTESTYDSDPLAMYIRAIAERDAEIAMLRGGRFSDRDWRALKSRAENAERELAAERQRSRAILEAVEIALDEHVGESLAHHIYQSVVKRLAAVEQKPEGEE